MANVLMQLSDGLASVVETAGPSLVRVEGRRRLAASGLIWSADGIIATANHVVTDRGQPKVGLADGRTLNADVIGRDPSTDLALLKIDASGLPVLPLADPEMPRVGHFVLALGRPGRGPQATLGIISALGDSWRTGAGGTIDRYLQTDVVMYPGFSGGPLVGAGGEIIGLNSSALARGVSITIPHGTVAQVAAALMTHGKVKQGYLGIKTQAVRLPEGLGAELDQETGLLIAGVEPGSPADSGGLFMGDTIVRFAGQPIRHPDDLLSRLNGAALDQKTPITVLRSGQLQELQIQVGEKA